jgi:hypothetical protein
MMPDREQSGPVFFTASADERLADFDEGIDLMVTSPPSFGMNDYVRSQYLTQLIFPDAMFRENLALEIGARRNRNSVAKLNEYLELLGRCFKSIGARMHAGGCVAVILAASAPSRASIRPQLDVLQDRLSSPDMKLLWTGSRRVIHRKINNTPFRDEHIWVLRRD